MEFTISAQNYADRFFIEFYSYRSVHVKNKGINLSNLNLCLPQGTAKWQVFVKIDRNIRVP
jgi:hypothetical protein